MNSLLPVTFGRIRRGRKLLFLLIPMLSLNCDLDIFGSDNQSSPTQQQTSTGITATDANVEQTADGGQQTKTKRIENINLLKSSQTQIIVSSTLNPRTAGPAKLNDGDVNTAWTSAPGDMRNAWLAIDVPDSAQVTSLRLTSGHLGQFEKLPRIKKLRIIRDNTPLGEFDIDPESPELQEIPVKSQGGLFKIEILDVLRGKRKKINKVTISELELWGSLTAENAQDQADQDIAKARVGTLESNERVPLISLLGLNKRTPREWEFLSESTKARAFPFEDRAYQRMIQGSFLRRARPLRLIELSGQSLDRVFLILFHVNDSPPRAEPAEPEQKTRRRRRRRPRKKRGCSGPEVNLCSSLYLARVSVPAVGIPVVDASKRVATDVCFVNSKIDLLDMDGDQKEEVYLRYEWKAHNVCGIGVEEMTSEHIADSDDLRVQYRGNLARKTGARCGTSKESVREARDLNNDGFHDFLIRTTVNHIECRARRKTPHRSFEEKRFFYDAGHDEWVAAKVQ